MSIIKISALALVLVFSSACTSDDDGCAVEYVDGMLIDMGKFDGCGWVLEYDGCMLEPSNLNQFNLTLTDSLSVRFAYAVSKEQVSACMVGTVVDLLDIYEK